ncbi:hypothetical protein [Rubellicoccus peritrichatus]|uniref:Uncharacterized protein n=1 Tax=Rubellicoccus peritrichatus TaxID=3080537 RepID=A0AAQ3L505_9BACT|nr:hypothetical protein [Puniceicoccus sp. CR14]WOO39494.1 hypothetical protein RZN69_12795 [Puniceicoccus sp. CR14]
MSKRDRILLTGLPAILILLIYGFFFAKPSSNELKDLQRKSGSLQSLMPSQAKQASVRGELAKLKAQLKKLRLQQSEGKALSLTAAPSNESMIEADAYFESLLEDYQVILMSEALAETTDARSFKRITSSSPGTALWNVELAGNYRNLAGLLAALGKTELPLTPVAVEMDASLQTQSNLRRWNLWIYR